MHITQIIIDGFKSYPSVTVVKGFDPQFNAITGANGSGKSNILDAICFVFGIQSLRLVRASNLKELIYKQGTSKVKDARVTIVFDNSNKALSPTSYTEYDTIEVTREITNMEKSKYKINGKNYPAEKVKSLFLSIHLNVNNPHFLVMQGKITQVVKMKPKQILSLIEETSGTALFEKRKEECLRMLERKELTLRNIRETIETQIEPMRLKIIESRENLRIYEENEAKIQEVEREIALDEYCILLIQAKNLKEKNDQDDEFFEEEKKSIEALEWEVRQLKIEIKTLDNNQEKENMEATGLEAVLKKHQKNLDVCEEDIRQKTIEIDSNDKKIKELSGKIDTENYLLEKYRNQKYVLKDKQTSLENDIANRENEMTQINYQLNEAKESGGGDSEEYKNQLSEKVKLVSENIEKVVEEIENHSDSISQNKIGKEINELKEKMKDCDKTVKENIKLHSTLSAEVKHLKEKTLQANSLKDSLNEIRAKKDILKTEEQKRRRELYDNQQLNRMNNILALNYRPPEGFNRNYVYGRILSLFSPIERKFCLPLEVIGGSQLF